MFSRPNLGPGLATRVSVTLGSDLHEADPWTVTQGWAWDIQLLIY